eukprot:TRINITY_DN5576_c0_g1_i3.p1 TRINITY_DN5576_c0_g1~~TRINITY_DN5576_c0_g1_i3.p1  ORF type:complete len:302 (+),score=24.75 TRINITY_DN5576_c0_g1_i3:86-907(+)
MSEETINFAQLNDAAVKDIENMYGNPSMRRQRQIIISKLQIAPGEVGADIGCGSGHLSREIVESCNQIEVMHGVDISPQLVAYCQQQAFLDALHQQKLQYAVGKADELPFPSSSLDFIVCTQVLEYLPNVQQVLQEFYRVLKPNGRCVIIDTDSDSYIVHSQNEVLTKRILEAFLPHAYDMHLPRTLRTKLTSAKFQVQAIETIPILETHFEHPGFWRYLTRFIANYVRNARDSDVSGEVDAWLADLELTAQLNQSFFCLNRFMFTSVKSLEQ